MKKTIFIFCTVPDKDTADIIGKKLIESRLAACVSFGSPLQSIYRWNGEIEESKELMMTIKTIRENYSKIEEQILSLHPYDLPEIVMLEIENGFKPYLAWIRSECR